MTSAKFLRLGLVPGANTPVGLARRDAPDGILFFQRTGWRGHSWTWVFRSALVVDFSEDDDTLVGFELLGIRALWPERPLVLPAANGSGVLRGERCVQRIQDPLQFSVSQWKNLVQVSLGPERDGLVCVDCGEARVEYCDRTGCLWSVWFLAAP